MAGGRSVPSTEQDSLLSNRPSAASWVWAAPAAFSLLVSLSCIGKAALWRDEMATREFSLLSLPALLQATSHVDRVLTPYYLFMHFWAFLGTGAVVMRLSSTIAATVAVAVCARLAQRHWGTTAGLVAGLTLGLNGVFIGTSVDARPYALVALFSVVATALLPRMTQDHVSRSVWWAYALALCAATLLHVFAVLIVLPHLLVLLRSQGRQRLIGWMVAAGPAVLLAGLMVALSASQSAQVYWSGGKPGPHDLARLLIAESGQSLKGVVLVVAVLFGAALQIRSRAVDDGWLTAAGLLLLPTAALFLVSQFSTPVLVARYVVTVQIGAALVIGAAISGLVRTVAADTRRMAVAAAVVGLILVAGVSAPGLHRTVTSTFRGDDYQTGDDYRSLAGALSAQAKRGDELIVRKNFSAGGFADGIAYYLGDSNFLASISSSLVRGEPNIYTRTVSGTNPFSTVEQVRGSRRGAVWVVELTPAVSAADPLMAQGCQLVAPSQGAQGQQFGDISMTEFRCPTTS